MTPRPTHLPRGDEDARAAEGQEAFALVVDTFAPHEAWDPPSKYVAMYDDPKRDGVEPIQPFATPFGMVDELGLDDDLLDRARNLYAAEMTFVDAWVGRFLQKLDDLRLERDTTVILLSDHGMTLGERGVIGKKPPNAFSEIHRAPYMIRDPAGRRAGIRASTSPPPMTSVQPSSRRPTSGCRERWMARTSPLLAGEEVPDRPVFTASYADQVLAGDDDWFLIADNQGKTRRLYRRDDEATDIADENAGEVDRLWQTILEQAGGPLPRLGRRASWVSSAGKGRLRRPRRWGAGVAIHLIQTVSKRTKPGGAAHLCMGAVLSLLRSSPGGCTGDPVIVERPMEEIPMRFILKRRPSPALVIAVLALFVAMGGTGYAAIRVTSTDVRDGSLTGADIRTNGVTGRDIKGVKGADLRNYSLRGGTSGATPLGRCRSRRRR